MTPGATLVVRADAGAQSGAGHVMRCLALMQAWWAQGGEPMLTSAQCPDGIVERVQSAGGHIAHIGSSPGSLADADETAAIAEHLNALWVVVDGYGFNASYVERLQGAGVRVVLIDDLGDRGRTGAAIVLNQNMHATPALYAAEGPSTQRLLGLDYFLLRAEFLPWRDFVRDVPAKARRIGLALGGADPTNQTLRLMRALDGADFGELQFDVIAGGANPRLNDICAAAQASRTRINVHINVADMARLLSEIDLLVSTAGVTAWEAAFLSTPMVLGTVGPQEEALAHRLAEARACLHVGPFDRVAEAAFVERIHALAHDQVARYELAAACAGLIDGRGPERVIDAMLRERALMPC
jgi:UDP-2,4-diacetamido-2,4,6-trideoxy-beta-L-altropyranose hydrolase